MKKKIIPIIIIVLALIAILVVAYLLLIKPTKKASEPVPVTFEIYDSLLYGNVQGYAVTLNNNGYITVNLDSSRYLLHYILSECTNPSENLDYTYTGPNGEISYDPLKEKIILDNNGNVQKLPLSEEEKEKALIKEKIYLIEAEGADPKQNLAISKTGTTTFNADGPVKFLFESKCDDAGITLKLYKI